MGGLPYYDELINVMLPEHQKEIAQRVIKYFVKSPKGKVVEEEIRDNIILSDGRNLLDVLLEGRNLVEMQSLLPSILSITSRRKHTRTNSENTIIESRKLYLSLSTEGALRYQVRLPSKEIATGLISKAELKQIHPYLATLSSPLTMLDLGLFERFKDEILKLTARNGHTKEVLFRSVTHDHQLSAGEVLYRLDNTDETFESVAEVPQRYPAQYSFLAVKLIHANFRVALYSLDENAIDQFFNTLKHSGGVSGWTMQGSNLFTRTYHHTTTESCASLAYRCLIAGGFYMALKTKLSSQTSSIVSPDDLLRHVVAFKQKELIPFPETERWISQEVDISSFNQAKIAYSQVNQNANAEDDILPLIPSIPRWSIPGCSIM